MEYKENEIAANIAYKMLQLFYIGIAIIFFQYFIKLEQETHRSLDGGRNATR